ncbi:conserved hypothetical protein [Tenacibaculum sediminilitoris]|uniref:hypothetical protein n=1 Tax=Tenacibaculum sediminilitoris TaxID=1820334 RepID=UPI003893A101
MKLTLNSLVLLIFSISVFYSCKNKEKSNEEKGKIAEYNIAVSDTLCSSSWFPHNQTPPPEEGKGSPFDVSSTTNAIFHQWSWQKFLWVTKPISETKLPLFLSNRSIHQVTSEMELVKQQEGAAVVLIDTAQAGRDSAILTTNPTYNTTNTSETVFYSIHTSDIMKKAADKFKDSILAGTLDKNNLSSFPVGSLELKVSWVATSAIASDKVANYFTTTAAVSRDGENYTNTEVALLGMHVVGVVENHPEFIWATFEHEDLAPNYDWKMNEASSDTNKLVFAKGNTTGIDGIVWNTNTNSAKLPNKAFDLFQYGVPRDNFGGFMTTCQQEPLNYDNVRDINACVKENLKDVFKHYFYNGSLWIDTDGLTPEEQATLLVDEGGNIDKATPGSVARGSLNNANVTMETFTQTFQSDISGINVNNLANCFSCHNAISYSGDKSPIYISHIFDAFMNTSEGRAKNEIELLKAKQEVEQFMKKSLQ